MLKTYVLLFSIFTVFCGCIPTEFTVNLEGGTDNKVIIVNCLNPKSPEEVTVCASAVSQELNCDNPRSEQEAQYCNSINQGAQ